MTQYAYHEVLVEDLNIGDVILFGGVHYRVAYTAYHQTDRGLKFLRLQPIISAEGMEIYVSRHKTVTLAMESQIHGSHPSAYSRPEGEFVTYAQPVRRVVSKRREGVLAKNLKISQILVIEDNYYEITGVNRTPLSTRITYKHLSTGASFTSHIRNNDSLEVRS